jgi:hypothetical protein
MDQIVSDFVAQTTLTNMKPNINKFEVALQEAVHEGTTVAGSISEFYIEPMLPCVGDVDLTLPDQDNIAVQMCPNIKVPPTYDPVVTVFAIFDTEYPAYVKLLKIGEVRKKSDRHNYTFISAGVADMGCILQVGRNS